jgi:hypothetical protein
MIFANDCPLCGGNVKAIDRPQIITRKGLTDSIKILFLQANTEKPKEFNSKDK